MSIAASLLLAAAAAASQGPAESADARGQGAQVDSAKVTVRILRPAVLRDGILASADGERAPRAQTVRQGERVTYEFE